MVNKTETNQTNDDNYEVRKTAKSYILKNKNL